MANELTLSASMTYLDGVGVARQLAVSGRTVTPSALKPAQTKQSIATSETTLKLGDTTAPGYAMLVNTDPTNYVDVKVAASGAIFARLDPDTAADGTGGFCVLKLGSGAQAPVAVANTAACLIDILIIPA